MQTALAKLPPEVQLQGLTVQKKSSAILQFVVLYSENGQQDPLFITNYAVINVLDVLSRIPGVGQASLIGALNYSMRIWFDTKRLDNLVLTPADVISAVEAQNMQAPVGRIGARPIGNDQQFQMNVQTQGRLSTPEQFGNIVLRANPDGSLLRVRDVARVELGAQNQDVEGRINGQPAVAIRISLAPGANAVETAALVRQNLENLSRRFPPGLKYLVNYDTTTFVIDTVRDVAMTLLIAFALVVVVVFLFLGTLRATLIPAVAVPVSLIGSFAVLLLMGYTANTISLLAMVLAIGILVDDAIVVVENVERVLEEEPHLSPAEATKKAMAEITGPIIAITLVLLSVFVPVAFIPGVSGNAIPAIRGDDQCRHAHFRRQCADLVAGAVRGVPAPSRHKARPDGLDIRADRKHARRLRGNREPAGSRVGAWHRGDPGERRGDLWPFLGHPDGISSRRRIRAHSSFRCNCPMGHRLPAPAKRCKASSACCDRCRRSRTYSRSSATRSSIASMNRTPGLSFPRSSRSPTGSARRIPPKR